MLSCNLLQGVEDPSHRKFILGGTETLRQKQTEVTAAKRAVLVKRVQSSKTRVEKEDLLWKEIEQISDELAATSTAAPPPPPKKSKQPFNRPSGVWKPPPSPPHVSLARTKIERTMKTRRSQSAGELRRMNKTWSAGTTPAHNLNNNSKGYQSCLTGIWQEVTDGETTAVLVVPPSASTQQIKELMQRRIHALALR
jgi:hypothetical protein